MKETRERLTDAYINYVLTHGEQPKSVYIFAKEHEVAEEEFYNLFGSFDGLERQVWKEFMAHTIQEVKGQEVWAQYTSREKALSLFYSFIEMLKSKRSFALYSLKHTSRSLGPKKVLEGLKIDFQSFSEEIIREGIDSKELEDRKFFTDKYKDALWIQFNFVLGFWVKDDSAGFDKTDEAIEKGVNVTFNFFQRSPVDELFEYGKFLVKNR